MTALRSAVEVLIKKIKQASDNTSRLMVELDWPKAVDPVDWLEAQAVFPKFYWQSRNEREEVVALGQVKTFTDPIAAEKVLADDQRIWGGYSFDGRTARNRRCLPSFFFLPQLEVIRIDQSWYLAANLSENKDKLISTLCKLRSDAPSLSGLRCDILSRQHTPDFATWSNMISQALDSISQKLFEKVVLARRTTLQLDKPLVPARLLKASRAKNSHSFHFMLALDEKHCFVGSTPERLFSRDAYELKTEALAGTIGRGRNTAEDLELANWLLADSKNRYENRLVVDDIVSRMQVCCSSLDVAETPELVRLRNVQHLKRKITGKLTAQTSSAQLLSNLQPTAAIAGLPREPALKFITEHEPFARGWYSGAVGYLSRTKSEFSVAIRSALVMGNDLHLFAGAGIVPGSTAASEWKELDRKTETLFSLLEPNPTMPEQKSA